MLKTSRQKIIERRVKTHTSGRVKQDKDGNEVITPKALALLCSVRSPNWGKNGHVFNEAIDYFVSKHVDKLPQPMNHLDNHCITKPLASLVALYYTWHGTDRQQLIAGEYSQYINALTYLKR